MKKAPLVSIIMNCYNGEKYLQEAVDSVLAQTYQNWELIFWDNQSTDKSADIIKRYNHEKFNYFYAPKHTVLYEARNYAIAKASGEFYAFLDVDDSWVQEKLEKQLLLFDDPEVGLVYGNYWIKHESRGTQNQRYEQILPSGRILNDLLKDYVVGLPTIVVRKEVFDDVKYPFNQRYNIIGDFDMVIRTALNWKLVGIQEPCATYRSHEHNISKNKELHLNELEDWFDTIQQDRVFSDMDGCKSVAQIILYMKGERFVDNKKYIDAFKVLFSLSFGLEKLKLLLIILAPKSFLKHFRN
tara:strand:+ start:12917 stop:13810 length:894 start_codon:yes stop_codon:yes gene_type:complete